MFGVVTRFEGASHLTVLCADGKIRFARIPGKMKRRSWIIVGDLVIVKPWAIEADKADVLFRYTKTQKSYLSRRRMLPQSME